MRLRKLLVSSGDGGPRGTSRESDHGVVVFVRGEVDVRIDRKRNRSEVDDAAAEVPGYLGVDSRIGEEVAFDSKWRVIGNFDDHSGADDGDAAREVVTLDAAAGEEGKLVGDRGLFLYDCAD